MVVAARQPRIRFLLVALLLLASAAAAAAQATGTINGRVVDQGEAVLP
jgi:type 1 fimbria pilin